MQCCILFVLWSYLQQADTTELYGLICDSYEASMIGISSFHQLLLPTDQMGILVANYFRPSGEDRWWAKVITTNTTWGSNSLVSHMLRSWGVPNLVCIVVCVLCASTHTFYLKMPKFSLGRCSRPRPTVSTLPSYAGTPLLIHQLVELFIGTMGIFNSCCKALYSWPVHVHPFLS